MTADENKEGVGYVPDDSDDGAEEVRSPLKNPHEDAGHRKKSTTKRSHPKIEEPQDPLQKALAEREEFKDKYLRGLAEIDNFRKRMRKEKDEFQRYVLSEFLLEMLQIYDNLERALKVKSLENEKGIVSGVEMIRKQFLDLLKKHQVHEIDALGKHFDPAFHEALSKEEREGITKPVVVEVYQKGFLYNDKLLRPVLTKVAIPVAKTPGGEPPHNP